MQSTLEHHQLLPGFNLTCTVYTCTCCHTEHKPKCDDTPRSPALYWKKKKKKAEKIRPDLVQKKTFPERKTIITSYQKVEGYSRCAWH